MTSRVETRTARPARAESSPSSSVLSRLTALDRRQLLITVGFVVLALLVLPLVLDEYWITICTSVAYMSVVALGLGLLYGRVGLASFGQFAVLGIGGWVALKFAFATSLPFPIVLLLAGLITMVIGTLVGLPALRFRGLYLALITLMLAGAISIMFNATGFPNGGTGFLASNSSVSRTVRRPSIATGDFGYYRYVVIVAVLMFALVLWHLRSKPGRAWAAIRQSEASALAAGINVTLYKLWAFALASFVTGVAGGLLAGGAGRLFASSFVPNQSITLLAVVLMGGIYSLWGAVVAGVLMQLLPAVLNDWSLPSDLLTILFGLGILQVVTTAPGGLAQQLPRDLRKLGNRLRRRRPPAAESVVPKPVGDKPAEPLTGGRS